MGGILDTNWVFEVTMKNAPSSGTNNQPSGTPQPKQTVVITVPSKVSSSIQSGVDDIYHSSATKIALAFFVVAFAVVGAAYLKSQYDEKRRVSGVMPSATASPWRWRTTASWSANSCFLYICGSKPISKIRKKVTAMQNANKKKITGAVALAAAGVMALGGVSMLFTDHADVSGETTAGKLAVKVTGTNPTNGDFTKQLENTEFVDAVQNLNPGDVRTISYFIENAENKAMRANDTLTVTVTPNEAMMADQSTNIDNLFAEFTEDKSAIHLVTGAKDDTKPVVTASGGTTTNVTFGDTGLTLVDSYVTEDKKNIVLVYQGDEVRLDGTGTNAEKITGNNGKTSSERKYTLYFNEDAGNEWQGADVSIGSTISAVQYANTAAGDATLNVEAGK